MKKENAVNKKPTAKHPDLALFDSWLEADETANGKTPQYIHLLFKEKNGVSGGCLDEMFEYINHAHEGARQSLRAPLGDSLHPLHYGTTNDPAFGYPYKFKDTVLQGYFGEILAGIIAEYYVGDDDMKWEVPVYLFRTHVVAFQQLEYMKQTDDWGRQIIGRTGDDGLAFIRDENNHIVAWLACEAKCTRSHSSTLIADNHKKLSQDIKRPIDLVRMISALKDYKDDAYAQNWIKALTNLYWAHVSGKLAERYDLSVYICGQLPRRTEAWIDTEAPHPEYVGSRELTAVEVHLPKVNDLIASIYARMEPEK